ncbi:hypothetical protein PV10_02269 [Exophiala mesophila]|uniref:DCG1-like protein n=1 Tax=Exophiala mesophila TaxID=212818 RepID=A0A0D2A6E7_EXOME|nr:uncharacterized protein PV10_02269 [Exophiala mesophila]KIV94508.1 hypothetical protein PV10_02269 [Exophiala mesophila]
MATTTTSPRPARILIINPNTSGSMTRSLEPLLNNTLLTSSSPTTNPTTQITYFTSPSPGIPSINSPADATASTSICLPHILPLLNDHDAILVACYSQHPLVSELQAACAAIENGRRRYVTGIFEASVLSSLALLQGTDSSFGIVSTGKIWEEALSEGVVTFLGGGSSSSNRFAGVETTGLNATDLHDLPAEQVNEKMKEATKRLLRRGKSPLGPVNAICLGCAGMAGLDEVVRQACVEELGLELGARVHIVDGVKAGVGILMGLVNAGF